MEVEVKGNKYTLKELGYIESLEIEEARRNGGLAQSIAKMFQLSGIPEDEVRTLTRKEGASIQEKINDINDLGDFQKPAEE